MAGIDEHKDGDEKKGSKISSLSTKKSRAAATHNQSERVRCPSKIIVFIE